MAFKFFALTTVLSLASFGQAAKAQTELDKVGSAPAQINRTLIVREDVKTGKAEVFISKTMTKVSDDSAAADLAKKATLAANKISTLSSSELDQSTSTAGWYRWNFRGYGAGWNYNGPYWSYYNQYSYYYSYYRGGYNCNYYPYYYYPSNGYRYYYYYPGSY